MTFVRTVLGDITSQNLGICYAHEHIIIDKCYATEKTPDFLLDSVEIAIRELTDFYVAGGRAVVDSMPCSAGRNVVKLAAVSRGSGVHIICPTGLHLAKYYPPGHGSENISVEELTEMFVADIETGVYAHDYNGPLVERTPHKAGVIKVAGSLNELTSRERIAFHAASKAHTATGCPVLTHTEQGTAALEQVGILRDGGVDLRHVVLSHTDRKPDPDYHRALLRTGVSLEYDSAFRWKTDTNPTFDLIMQLLPEFPYQIVIGMDAARRGYWKHYGGSPGLSYLLTEFIPSLHQAGLSSHLLENLLIYNPARAYSFVA